jgi:hypothetical protein
VNKLKEMIDSGKFKSYLGDSVYANYDGYHIILTTENGLPNDPSNKIALESGVLHALNRYSKNVIDLIQMERQKEEDK